MKSSNSGYTMRCIICNEVNDERKTSTYCTNCGGVLTIEYNEVRKEIQFPLKNIIPDPLKNHYTALKHLTRLSEKYGADLYAKLELENPTGCFKDRGSYVEVLKALELGADAICLASTGNRSEEHTSELQSRPHLVCRLLLEKKKQNENKHTRHI